MDEMISVPKPLLERIKKYIEFAEYEIENEWGEGRHLQELIDDGDVCIEYYEICKLLDDHDRT